MRYSPFEQFVQQQQLDEQKRIERRRAHDALLASMSEQAAQSANSGMQAFLAMQAREEDREMREKEREEDRGLKERELEALKEYRERELSLREEDIANRLKIALQARETEKLKNDLDAQIAKDIGEKDIVEDIQATKYKPLQVVRGKSGAEYIWNDNKLTKIGEKDKQTLKAALSGLSEINNMEDLIHATDKYQVNSPLVNLPFVKTLKPLLNKAYNEVFSEEDETKSRLLTNLQTSGLQMQREVINAVGGAGALNSNVELKQAMEDAINPYNTTAVRLGKLDTLRRKIENKLKHSGLDVPEYKYNDTSSAQQKQSRQTSEQLKYDQQKQDQLEQPTSSPANLMDKIALSLIEMAIPKKQQYGALESVARNAALPLSEIAKTFGHNSTFNNDLIKKARESRDENPITGSLGYLGGSLPLGLGVSKALGVVSKALGVSKAIAPGKFLNDVLAGATIGAATGEDQPLHGAVIGGGMGAAGGAINALLSKSGGVVKNIGKNMREGAEDILENVNRYKKAANRGLYDDLKPLSREEYLSGNIPKPTDEAIMAGNDELFNAVTERIQTSKKIADKLFADAKEIEGGNLVSIKNFDQQTKKQIFAQANNLVGMNKDVIKRLRKEEIIPLDELNRVKSEIYKNSPTNINATKTTKTNVDYALKEIMGEIDKHPLYRDANAFTRQNVHRYDSSAKGAWNNLISGNSKEDAFTNKNSLAKVLASKGKKEGKFDPNTGETYGNIKDIRKNIKKDLPKEWNTFKKNQDYLKFLKHEAPRQQGNISQSNIGKAVDYAMSDIEPENILRFKRNTGKTLERTGRGVVTAGRIASSATKNLAPLLLELNKSTNN